MSPYNAEALTPIFDMVMESHRWREYFMNLRKQIASNIGASIRREKNNPDLNPELSPAQYYEKIIEGTKFDEIEKRYKKIMIEEARKLPLYDWWCAIDGCGELTFAQVLAETGNLSNYSNPAKVWKRMGLAVRGGEKEGEGEAEKNMTKGINTGYNKRRRTVAYNLSEAIIKKQGHYREVFVQRKEFETARDAEGYNKPYIERRKERMLRQYGSAENKEKIENGRLPQDVINLRSLRYMVKRLLRDFWIEWQREMERNGSGPGA